MVAGAHNIRVNESSQVTVYSEDFIVHENWNDYLIQNDIALIRLPSSLTWTRKLYCANRVGAIILDLMLQFYYMDAVILNIQTFLQPRSLQFACPVEALLLWQPEQ